MFKTKRCLREGLMAKGDVDDRGWNPYLAGFLTGLLLIASVWFTGKYHRRIDNFCSDGRFDRAGIFC